MIYFIAFLLWLRRSKRAFPIFILGGLLVALAGNTAGFMYFDGAEFKDAWWYSIISITTIGYGDYSASSLGARLSTVFFIAILGLVVFGAAAGGVIEAYQAMVEKGRKGMSKIHATDHVVIVNFPNEARVIHMIEELSKDESYKNKEIVLVTDQITELPASVVAKKHIQFVYGSPLESETFERANVKTAYAAIVLATDYNDAKGSDSLVSSTVLVIESLNGGVHTIAECIDRNHRFLFESSQCDSIVCGLVFSQNLLIQEMQDHGIAAIFETIMSNDKSDGDTVYTTTIPATDGTSYNEIAKGLLDKGANLIAVVQDDKKHTCFSTPLGDGKRKDLITKEGDSVAYLFSRRLTYDELIGMMDERKARKAREAELATA